MRYSGAQLTYFLSLKGLTQPSLLAPPGSCWVDFGLFSHKVHQCNLIHFKILYVVLMPWTAYSVSSFFSTIKHTWEGRQ